LYTRGKRSCCGAARSKTSRIRRNVIAFYFQSHSQLCGRRFAAIDPYRTSERLELQTRFV
jgi:hypothetical protein